MLDSKWFRAQLDEAAQKLATRGYTLDVTLLRDLEQQRKALQIRTEQLRSERNQQAKAVGLAKAAGRDVAELVAQSEQYAQQLDEAELALNDVSSQLQEIMLTVPNIPHESTPIGRSESQNQEVRRWGEPPVFSFTPKDHVDLGEALHLMDFNAASQLSGARFVVLHGALARLERALGQFMLDTHTQNHQYQEVNVPYLVSSQTLYGTGQLPKFAQEQFFIKDRDLALIPTAEVPVTNLARDKVYEAKELPVKYVCYSACFRSEAGSYGKDTRGMLRQHQFEKVELVQLVQPELSYAALEELTHHAETILQLLKLPYRAMALCTGDIGFAAAKTYDLEVWLPGQQTYREISSCSNTESFQARRMQARWRNPETGKPELLHTLNGSGLAVGRTLIAVMENYQDEAGHIHVPEVLQPYMGGVKVI